MRERGALPASPRTKSYVFELTLRIENQGQIQVNYASRLVVDSVLHCVIGLPKVGYLVLKHANLSHEVTRINAWIKVIYAHPGLPLCHEYKVDQAIINN